MLPKAALSALSAAVHKRAKVFLVYVSGREQARDAIQAGADGLVAYGLGEMSLSPRYYPPDVQELAASRRVFVIPSMTTLQLPCLDHGADVLDDRLISPFLPPAYYTDLKTNIRGSAKMVCDNEH